MTIDFGPFQDKKRKVLTVDRVHPVILKPQPRKYKKRSTNLSHGPGRERTKETYSKDGRYRIEYVRRKYKTFRLLFDPDACNNTPTEVLIGGADTFEEAIGWAIKDASKE